MAAVYEMIEISSDEDNEPVVAIAPNASTQETSIEIATCSTAYVGKDEKLARKERKKALIKRLKSRLRFCKSEIERISKMELSLDEMEHSDSAYMRESKLKKTYFKLYEQLCALEKNEPTLTVRRKKIHVHASPYPEINRGVEDYVNSSNSFPDLFDIKNVISEVCKRNGLNLKPPIAHGCAVEVFTEVGQKLQRRRKKEFRKYSGCSLTDEIVAQEDPATYDRELRRKLKQNMRSGASKLNSIFVEFTKRDLESNHNYSSGAEEEDSTDVVQVKDDRCASKKTAVKRGTGSSSAVRTMPLPMQPVETPHNELQSCSDKMALTLNGRCSGQNNVGDAKSGNICQSSTTLNCNAVHSTISRTKSVEKLQMQEQSICSQGEINLIALCVASSSSTSADYSSQLATTCSVAKPLPNPADKLQTQRSPVQAQEKQKLNGLYAGENSTAISKEDNILQSSTAPLSFSTVSNTSVSAKQTGMVKMQRKNVDIEEALKLIGIWSVDSGIANKLGCSSNQLATSFGAVRPAALSAKPEKILPTQQHTDLRQVTQRLNDLPAGKSNTVSTLQDKSLQSSSTSSSHSQGRPTSVSAKPIEQAPIQSQPVHNQAVTILNNACSMKSSTANSTAGRSLSSTMSTSVYNGARPAVVLAQPMPHVQLKSSLSRATQKLNDGHVTKSNVTEAMVSTKCDNHLRSVTSSASCNGARPVPLSMKPTETVQSIALPSGCHAVEHAISPAPIMLSRVQQQGHKSQSAVKGSSNTKGVLPGQSELKTSSVFVNETPRHGVSSLAFLPDANRYPKLGGLVDISVTTQDYFTSTLDMEPPFSISLIRTDKQTQATSLIPVPYLTPTKTKADVSSAELCNSVDVVSHPDVSCSSHDVSIESSKASNSMPLHNVVHPSTVQKLDLPGDESISSQISTAAPFQNGITSKELKSKSKSDSNGVEFENICPDHTLKSRLTPRKMKLEIKQSRRFREVLKTVKPNIFEKMEMSLKARVEHEDDVSPPSPKVIVISDSD